MKRLGKNLAMLVICAAMVIGLLLGMSLTALADQYVASVTPSGGTTTNYNDFAKALSYWTGGSTLKLLDDVSYDQQIEVKNSKTLDLNGCVFTIASSLFHHILVNNSTLTIKDSGTSGRLTTATKNRLFGIINNGCLEINGGILESTSDADWTLIFVDNNSSVTLNDGVLKSKASNAVYVQNGTLNLSGGTINCESASNNMSTSSAVVHGYKNEYIIVVNWTGTEIHTKAGYAFYTGESQANCTLNISGKPKDSGKGVYLRNNVFITVTGELQNSSPIGITLESKSGVFTNSVNTTYNDASKFKSNDASYAVGKNADGQLFLGTAISSVSVTDITAPVANEALDTAASTSTSNVTLSTVTWSPTTTPAAYATEYTATVTATAEAGYAFPDNPEVTVNGKPASKVSKNPDGTLQIEYNFPRTKQLVTITAKDGEVPYATEGISIPVEGMFTIPDGAGAATYSVTNDTGEGTYNAKNGKLSVSKCGTFNVSVSTAATETHLAAQSEARLTVNKAVPTVTAPVAKTLFYNEQLQELVTEIGRASCRERV